MEAPKFAVGQQVKFTSDHDKMTGKVIEILYSTSLGFSYKISSRYYDVEQNGMVEGHKICREEELVDMAHYTGTTEQEKATHTVGVNDTLNTEGETA